MTIQPALEPVKTLREKALLLPEMIAGSRNPTIQKDALWKYIEAGAPMPASRIPDSLKGVLLNAQMLVEGPKGIKYVHCPKMTKSAITGVWFDVQDAVKARREVRAIATQPHLTAAGGGDL